MLSWDKMNSVDLKVLGQSLKLNVSKGEEQYYKPPTRCWKNFYKNLNLGLR